jgi:hypothetical protein
LKNDEIEYHTYTHKSNKTHAFVLRGLHQGPAPKEVAEALVEEDVDANEIYNMRGSVTAVKNGGTQPPTVTHGPNVLNALGTISPGTASWENNPHQNASTVRAITPPTI